MEYLLAISVRSLALGCLAWLVLHTCRVKSASAKHAVWTVLTAVMLLQAAVSRELPSIPVSVLAPLPADTEQIATPYRSLELAASASNLPVRARTISWEQMILAVYTTGVIVLLIQLLRSYIFTRKLMRHSTAIDSVPARESDWISVPMTVGRISPVILLPVRWREWDPAKLQAVLAHEQAHVRRADWTIGVMARVNCCVFWFHPLAWWLKKQLAELAEYACDDRVLAQAGDRQQYAQTLLEIATAMKSAHGRLLSNAMPMAKETHVQKRMDRILDETRKIPAAFGRPAWIALAMCSLPIAYLASTLQLVHAQSSVAIPVAHPARTADPAPLSKKRPERILAQAKAPAVITPQAPAATPAASPYQKWVNEEVTWIISDEERLAFQRLKADEEREQFIEQFWLRRDPTPGTPENEMKEETYRRIAWANDKFTAGIPGWETDRGIVYIKYGPPDALDSHGATPSTFPYEVWRYANPGGLGPTEFEFVDPGMTGRYHLTRDPSEKNRQ